MTATPVVGREAELDQLDRQLERALHGQSATCFVTGEPGAGKSSLAMEFARRAQLRAPELLVTYGTCDAYTGTGDAYLPFREVLQQLTGDVERSLAAGRTSHEGARRLDTFALFAARALVENGADLVGLFVPGGSLLTRIGGMAVRRHRWAQQLHQKLYGGSEQPTVRMLQQQNVFEQYTQVLDAMSSERPLLILLDDLHWADVASIGLLFHLSRRLVNARLMIIGVYRSEEVSRPRDGKPHPLQGMVAELMRLHAELAVIDLDNLRARSFIDALVDAGPNRLDERFRDSLARHTAGNPLFAVELLQSLQASGALATSSAGTLEQVSAIEWRSLPSRVTGVIESRTALLTPAQKEILAAASVQGEEFVADAVAEVLRLERRNVVRELSGPMQKELRLVTAVGMQGVGSRLLARYRFRHNLVQDYLYRQLDEVERAELHGATGLALERIHEHDPASVAVALATHFTAAGDWSSAIRYRLLAGDSAARAFGHDEAVEHFEQALALGERQPLVGDAAMDRIAVRERLGDELLLLRKWASSAASFSASFALIDPAARTARARLLRKLARIDERQSRYADAMRHLEAAQAQLGDPDELEPNAWWGEWIDIQIALSFVYYWEGDVAGMDATDARVAPVIEDRGTPIQRSQFYAARARRGLRQTRYCPDTTTMESAERAVATLEAYPDELLQAETVFLLAFTQLWSERFAEAHKSFERAIAVSHRFGDSTHRLRSLVYGSVGERRLGHIEEVQRLVNEANDLMRQLDSDEYMPVVLAQNVWLAWRRGDDARARTLLEESLPVSRQRVSRFPFHWLLLWVQVAMQAAAGDVADAADAATTMLEPPLSRQRDDVEQHLRRISAARGGDPAELRRELDLGLEAARAAGYL